MGINQKMAYANWYLTTKKQEENLVTKIKVFIGRVSNNDVNSELYTELLEYVKDIYAYFLEKLRNSPCYILHETLFPYILKNYDEYVKNAEKKYHDQDGIVEEARKKLLTSQMELIKICAASLDEQHLTQLKFEELIKPHLQFKLESSLKDDKAVRVDYGEMWKEFSYAMEKRKNVNPELLQNIYKIEDKLNIPKGTLVPMMINDFIAQETWENTFGFGWDQFADVLVKEEVLKTDKSNPIKEKIDNKLKECDEEIKKFKKSKSQDKEKTSATDSSDEEFDEKLNLKLYQIQKKELLEKKKTNYMCKPECKVDVVNFQLEIEKQLFDLLYDYINVGNFKPNENEEQIRRHNQKAELEAEINEKYNIQKQFEEEIQVLEVEINKKNNRKKEFEEEIEKLEAEINEKDNIQKQFEEEIEKLQVKLNEEEDVQKQLQEEIINKAEFEAEINEKYDILKQLQEEIEIKKEELEAEINEKYDIQKNLSKVKVLKEELEKEINLFENKKNWNDIHSKLKKVKQEKMKLEQDKCALEQKIENFQQIEKIRAEIIEKEQNLNKLEEKKASFKYQKNKNETQLKLDKVKAEKRELEKKLAPLEKENWKELKAREDEIKEEFLWRSKNFQNFVEKNITDNGPLKKDKLNEFYKEWAAFARNLSGFRNWQNANYFFDLINILENSANDDKVLFSVIELLQYNALNKLIYENKVEVSWKNQLLSIESSLLNSIEAIISDKNISVNHKQVLVKKEIIKTLKAIKMISNCNFVPSERINNVEVREEINHLVNRVKIIAAYWHEEGYITKKINTNFAASSRRLLLSQREQLIFDNYALKVSVKQYYENLEASKKNVKDLYATCHVEIEKECYFNYFFSESEDRLEAALKNADAQIELLNFVYSEKYWNAAQKGFGREFLDKFFAVQKRLLKERNYKVWTNLNTLTNNLIEEIKNEEFFQLKATVGANKKIEKIEIMHGNMMQIMLAKLKKMASDDSPYAEGIRKKANELYGLMSSTNTKGNMSEEQNKNFLLVRKFIEIPHKELPLPNPEKLAQISKSLEQKYPNFKKVITAIIDDLKSQTMLQQDGTGAVICLSGSPGIGKTQFAQDFAAELGWAFDKVSYSGLTNPESIVGFSSTYLGAKQGAFANALIKTQPLYSKSFPNQLSQLDDEEIDDLETLLSKIEAIDTDCSSALAEVSKDENYLNHIFLVDEIEKASISVQEASLDLMEPKQRKASWCKFFDAPIDFSRSIWIATCNDKSKIFPPLSDRLKIFEIESPTEEHKFKIFNEVFEKHLQNGIENWNKGNPNQVLEIVVTEEARKKIFDDINEDNDQEGLRIIIDCTKEPVLKLFTQIIKDAKEDASSQKLSVIVDDSNINHYIPLTTDDDETNTEDNSFNIVKTKFPEQGTSKASNQEKIYNFLVPTTPDALAINSYELSHPKTFKTCVDNAIATALTRTTSVTKTKIVTDETKKMSKEDILKNIIWKSWATVAFDDSDNKYARKFKAELDNMSKLQICLNPNSKEEKFFDVDEFQIGLQQLKIKETEENVLSGYNQHINKLFDRCYQYIYAFEQGQCLAPDPLKDETPEQKTCRLLKLFSMQIILSDEATAQKIRSNTSENVTTSKAETVTKAEGVRSHTSAYNQGAQSTTYNYGGNSNSTTVNTGDAQTFTKHTINSKNNWGKLFLKELTKEKLSKRSDFNELFASYRIKKSDLKVSEADINIDVSYQTAFNLVKVQWNNYKKLMDEYHVPIFMLMDQIQTTVLNKLNYLLEREKEFSSNICMYEILDLGIEILETLDDQLYKYDQTLNILCGEFDNLMLKNKGKEVTITEGRHHLANDAINLRDLFCDLLTKTNDCIIVFEDEKDKITSECKVEKTLSIHEQKKKNIYDSLLEEINKQVNEINKKLQSIEEEQQKIDKTKKKIITRINRIKNLKNALENDNSVKIILPPHIQSLIADEKLIKFCCTSAKLMIKQKSPLVLKRRAETSDKIIAIPPHAYTPETNVTKEFKKTNRNIVNFTKQRKEINDIGANDNITCQYKDVTDCSYTIKHGFDKIKNENYAKKKLVSAVSVVHFEENPSLYTNPTETILQGKPTDYQKINLSRNSTPFYKVSDVENRMESFALVQKEITYGNERESVVDCLLDFPTKVSLNCFV